MEQREGRNDHIATGLLMVKTLGNDASVRAIAAIADEYGLTAVCGIQVGGEHLQVMCRFCGVLHAEGHDLPQLTRDSLDDVMGELIRAGAITGYQLLH